MPDRYKKIQPKLKPLPFIIIGIIIVTIVLLVIFLRDTPKQAFYKEYTAHGARHLDEDHVFKEISYKTFNKKLGKNEKMLVYFGSPTCPVCVEEVPLYNKEFKTESLNMKEYFDYIYYIDDRKLKSNQIDEITDKYFYSPEDSLFLYFEDGEVAADRYMFMSGQSAQGNIYLFLKEVKNQQK